MEAILSWSQCVDNVRVYNKTTVSISGYRSCLDFVLDRFQSIGMNNKHFPKKISHFGHGG